MLIVILISDHLYHCLGRVQQKHLQLIKWVDARGKTQRFRLMEKISGEWRSIGTLVDLSFSQLDSIAAEHHHKQIDCCRTVLRLWMENPPEDYPATWRGLLELLCDSELRQVATDLEDVLKNSNDILKLFIAFCTLHFIVSNIGYNYIE